MVLATVGKRLFTTIDCSTDEQVVKRKLCPHFCIGD
jgi:hypothetical protein